MNYPFAIAVCLVLMGVTAYLTYYLGKKVSYRFMKYIPVFTLGMGVIFFSIKIMFIPYQIKSVEKIYDMMALIILTIILSVSFLEAFVVEIVENGSQMKVNFLRRLKEIQSTDYKKLMKKILSGHFVKKWKQSLMKSDLSIRIQHSLRKK